MDEGELPKPSRESLREVKREARQRKKARHSGSVSSLDGFRAARRRGRLFRRILVSGLVLGALGGAGWLVETAASREQRPAAATVSTSPTPVPTPSPTPTRTPSPTPSPPFTLGEIVRDELTGEVSVSGLHLLEPGDCFELEYADAARTTASAVEVPSCAYPHRFEYVVPGDYRNREGFDRLSRTQRSAVYTRDCNDAAVRYTGVPIKQQDRPAAPFHPISYSSVDQPVDDLKTNCVLVTWKHKPTTRSFRAPARS